MESLNELFNQLLPNYKVNKMSVLNKIKNNKLLIDFIKSNDISNQEINNSLTTLHKFIEESENCNNCKALEQCPNMLLGYYTEIKYTNGQIHSTLVKCSKKALKEKEDIKQSLFKSQYVPNDIIKATFKSIDRTEEREDALAALLEFCINYRTDKKQKGIYLFGPLGVGKSYMMAATANKLAESNISTLMIYVPDFFREIKNSIKDDSLNDKLDLLKSVEVLIMDDIGAETISQWERDEILGSILQARMVKNLPTLYTSNFGYDDLEEHLAYSNKGGEERLKAKRIMERIRHYTDIYFVDGPNKRKDIK